ncbi:unnamed protein product, partial [Prorocentrum cordatum]
MELLTQDGGLEGLGKDAVVRKQQKLDDIFKRSRRCRGQDIIEHLRTSHNKYKELADLDQGTKLNDDLCAYFLFEGVTLNDDQKRLMTTVADNRYETESFEKTLKTN